MNMRKLFDFLRDLQRNNSKEWMDEHRDEYEAVRDDFIAFLNKINEALKAVDPDYQHTPGKTAIHRINNNLLYHPDKPTYKDHFGGSLDQAKNRSDFYLHIGVNGSFIAGGFYHPSNPTLKKIRDAIDYDGEKLKEIINDPSFQETFDLLEEDKLKTSPKGYSQDHRHIALLRLKNFAVSHSVTQKEVIAEDFKDRVLRVYEEMLPFRRYLDRAVSV